MPKYSISGGRYNSSEKKVLKKINIQTAPGPGAYETQLDSKYIKAPGYSILGRTFNGDFKKIGPGPGSYLFNCRCL